MRAAVACAERGIARSVLLGHKGEVAEAARGLGLKLPDGIDVVDPRSIYTMALTAIQARAG